MLFRSASCFQKYQDIEFEGMMFRGFVDYDTYLKLLYKDYMQIPPEDKRSGSSQASCIKLIDITLDEIHRRYLPKQQSDR